MLSLHKLAFSLLICIHSHLTRLGRRSIQQSIYPLLICGFFFIRLLRQGSSGLVLWGISFRYLGPSRDVRWWGRNNLRWSIFLRRAVVRLPLCFSSLRHRFMKIGYPCCWRCWPICRTNLVLFFWRLGNRSAFP